MIHKKAPYKGRRMEDVKRRIKENKVIFKKDVDPEIKKTIIYMLQMAPAKRPSVAQVLEIPFIREIRNQMDAKFFATKNKIEKNSAKTDNKNSNEKINYSNLKFFGGFESNNNKPIDKADKINNLNLMKWNSNASKTKNLNQSFNLKASKYNSKFQSNQMNYIPEKNAKIFKSTRNIINFKNHENLNYSRPIVKNKKKKKTQLKKFNEFKQKHHIIKNNKLFHSYNEQNKVNGDKCITEPSSILKNSNYISGNINKKMSFYSKKKELNINVLKNDSLNLPINMFKKKNKIAIENVNENKISNSYFGDYPKDKTSNEKRNSSKENNNNIGINKTQLNQNEIPDQSKKDLKQLLHRNKMSKPKEFTIKPTLPESNNKLNLSKNYITYKSNGSKGLNKSFNYELLGNKIKKNMLNNIKNLSKQELSHQSMVVPKKKLKQQKSIRYINCDWTKQSSIHHKSRSFNENTLKTKLVLRRKDSIQDLKKKLSNRQIKNILQKPNSKIENLNRSYQNPQILKKQPKSKHKHGLKRNLSMATGIAIKPVTPNHGSEGKPIAQKSLQSMIQNFNISKKREPITNVFQLQSNNKRVPINSFCFSHRVDNLNPQIIKSKLKGFSQRNIVRLNHETSFTNKSFQKVFDSTHISSSRYQEPFIKPKYVSDMHQKWRKRYKSGGITDNIKQGFYSEIKTIDINS